MDIYDESLFFSQSSNSNEILNINELNNSDNKYIDMDKVDKPCFALDNLNFLNESDEATVTDDFLRFDEMDTREINTLIQSMMSKGTVAKSKWGLSVFKEWCQFSVKSCGVEYPDILFMDEPLMNDALRLFVWEVKNKSGEHYKPWFICLDLILL